MTEDISPYVAEMNRGFLQVLVLIALETPMYGYAMIQAFRERGYEVEESTLYPLLRRLEKNGLIRGEWDVTGSRPKKYYRVTAKGHPIRENLLLFWQKQDAVLKDILKEGSNV
jgi:PadR family transcriptional regulator PadR